MPKIGTIKPMPTSRELLVCAVVLLASAMAGGQETAGATTEAPPVAYASVSELNGILTPLQKAAESVQSDLGKTRIEKWKTDNATKRQTLANVESIQRNLKSALPEIVAELSRSPEDMGASFKFYRNLDALYDVFGSVVESAGAFGSKDEFQTLSNDMTGIETARRAMAERMQKLAASKEDELTRLRAQVKALSAAVTAPAPPPKKIVVDDTEPPKKPVKKKATKPKPPAAASDAAPSAAPPK